MRTKLLYKLLKSLHKLKQLGKLWNQNIIAFYKNIRFIQLNGNLSILIQQIDSKIKIVNIYIYDFLLTLEIIDTLNKLKKLLSRKYNIKEFSKVKIIIDQQITKNLKI